MPAYQSRAVKNWFKRYSKDLEAGDRGFGKDKWNSTGNARAYPDVSANGAGYVVALVGSYDYLLYGTSASTPVFGAIVTLINEARMNKGKGSVGFLSMFISVICSFVWSQCCPFSKTRASLRRKWVRS